MLQTLCRSMSGNIRAADVTAGVLACVILASVAVAVTQLLTPTYPFSYSVDAAKRFGAIAAGSLVAFFLAAATRYVSPRLSLRVTRRLAVVVAVLASYEALLFAVIAPRFIGDVALPIGASRRRGADRVVGRTRAASQWSSRASAASSSELHHSQCACRSTIRAG